MLDSSNLLELLDESSKKGLVNNLLENKSEQEGLFMSGEKNSLNIILDELFSLIEQRGSLYCRWTQKIENKERQLSVPKKPLRKFMDSYLLSFIKKSVVHKGCHGGERGWSVKKSLETHLPCVSVLSFDLKNAFENIPFSHVYDLFYDLLDNLLDWNREKVTEFLSVICTVEYPFKRGLPQGSPCSMALFNRILYSLDNKLYLKSKERGFRYSRWVDDITISSSSKEGIENFLGAVELTDRHFYVSEEKIFFQDDGEIYLLGYKIFNNKIGKNTKEEKLRNKKPFINPYEWFGKNRIRNYGSWTN